jgi:hypothetical protein
LKEESLDRTLWRTRLGRDYGPVVRQTTEWMNVLAFHPSHHVKNTTKWYIIIILLLTLQLFLLRLLWCLGSRPPHCWGFKTFEIFWGEDFSPMPIPK